MYSAVELSDTIAAIATPAGTGAIAMIRLSGQDAFKIADTVFLSRKGKIAKAESHTALFGTVVNDGEIIDEVLALVFKNPHSFTGDDTVEFTCHGSAYIQKRILGILLDHGARLAEPGEFTMRAFLNKKMDLTQAEAVGDLIAADTSAAHAVALNQMRGGFSKDLNFLREQLINFASLLELELDFSEEDVEFADRKQLIESVKSTLSYTQKLANSFEAGNVIRNGIPVTIAGKPNVGKSTLLNLILNEDRAIVSDIAGTTRDTIEEEITIGGMKYRFIDTAGIRDTQDIIEQSGVERTMEKIKQAAVIIYLFDPVETNVQSLGEILEKIKSLRMHDDYLLLPVANKSDKYNKEVLKKEFASIPDVIFISAKEHAGINLLFENITINFNSKLPGTGDTILTNARHKNSLDKTITSLLNVKAGLTSGLSTDLVAIEIRSALMHLGEITGQISTDDLLVNIFSKFCIGK
jgi:tRNA modification GTPase